VDVNFSIITYFIQKVHFILQFKTASTHDFKGIEAHHRFYRYHNGSLWPSSPLRSGVGWLFRLSLSCRYFTLQILTPSDCFLYVIVIPCLLAHRCRPCFCVVEMFTMNESPIFNSRQGYLVFRGKVGNGMSWSICIIGVPIVPPFLSWYPACG
jgi:hypothetical protein